MDILFVYLFVFGLMVGSFLNVFIYRWPIEEQWVKGRSKCMKCKHELSWVDLVPVLSFVFLLGKCKYCGVKLSWQYPLVELANALGWVWIGWMAMNGTTIVGIGEISWSEWGVVKTLCLMALWSMSLAALVIDLKHLLLPDELTIGMVILGITLIFIGSPLPWPERIISGLVGMGCFYLLHWGTRGMGMGLGDVKLVGGMGMLLGWDSGLAVAVGFVAGSMVGIMMLITGKTKFGRQIAFGPFLILGTWVVLVWGRVILEGYRGLMGV